MIQGNLICPNAYLLQVSTVINAPLVASSSSPYSVISTSVFVQGQFDLFCGDWIVRHRTILKTPRMSITYLWIPFRESA